MKSEMQTANCVFIGMEGSNNWGSVLGAAIGYPSMLGPILWTSVLEPPPYGSFQTIRCDL